MTEHSSSAPAPPRGRGAPTNPKGRFERLEIAYEPEPEEDEAWQPPRKIKTLLFKDTARRVVSFNDSPDVGLTASLNPYRGCEHGCIYCYARPTHEYLGLSAGLDFESKIFVKTDAPALLAETLRAPSWKPQTVAMSGVTDCYQPVERKLKLTRQCLEVLAEFRNPGTIITKSHLVTRDIDVLKKLAAIGAARVFVSITTLDAELARVLEPRASRPEMRLAAIRELTEAGIPAGVMMAPILPGLTDHEIPTLLERAAEAGAIAAGHTILRLPYGVKDLFQEWLEAHYPLRKEKVLSRIRDVRGGALNDSAFGTRMTGQGPYADTIHTLFAQSCKRLGLDRPLPRLSIAHFRRAEAKQLSLF